MNPHNDLDQLHPTFLSTLPLDSTRYKLLILIKLLIDSYLNHHFALSLLILLTLLIVLIVSILPSPIFRVQSSLNSISSHILHKLLFLCKVIKLHKLRFYSTLRRLIHHRPTLTVRMHADIHNAHANAKESIRKAHSFHRHGNSTENADYSKRLA